MTREMFMSINYETPRKGEDGSLPNRSERCFQDGQYWYYKTREKIKIGPFDDVDSASKGVDTFVEFIQLEPDFTKTLERYRKVA
jgi:hypothetical protein